MILIMVLVLLMLLAMLMMILHVLVMVFRVIDHIESIYDDQDDHDHDYTLFKNFIIFECLTFMIKGDDYQVLCLYKIFNAIFTNLLHDLRILVNMN